MASTLPPPSSMRSRAIVLVHGAWVGDWSWLPIEQQLRASGRPVHVVALTGQGSRRHENGPHVTLAHHVADVRNVIEVHDLTDITLVGHSYGGRVITQVWSQVSERIASMVYLDAHAPVTPDKPQTPERRAHAAANGGMIPFEFYHPSPELVGGPEGVAWFESRVVPHPFNTFDTPWQVALPDALPKTYVFAAGDEPSRFAAYAAAAKVDPAWTYVEIAGTHMLMFSHPAEVTDLILAS
jgi:pimeloyl-ACP methyl ester carboxylesterase